MSWTINENSKTSTTEYFNANYSDSVPSPGVAPNTVTTAFTSQNAISGYSSGTISFTISQPPSEWLPAPPSAAPNMIFRVMGKIDTNIFIASFQQKTRDNTSLTTTTFYVEWDIPLQDVALGIVNNSGVNQVINNIRIQTESSGGGASGVHSSSGSEVGPGGLTPQIQFNDGGIFGGASGALYDKNAGQIKLANGTAVAPMLAFSGGIHPLGNYNTGIYGAGSPDIAFHGGGNKTGGIYGTPVANFIKGLNIGTTSNLCGIRRLSETAANSWEDGHMGNSDQLVFTGSDFTDFSRLAQAPVLFAVSSTALRNYGLVAGARADPNRPDEFIAVREIPKGFQISNEAVTVAAANQTTDVWGSSGPLALRPTIQLLIQDINSRLPTPSPNPSSLGGPTVMDDWEATGLNEQYTPSGPNLAANPGNGTRTLIVKITVRRFQITRVDALVGVVVPIERV